MIEGIKPKLDVRNDLFLLQKITFCLKQNAPVNQNWIQAAVQMLRGKKNT